MIRNAALPAAVALLLLAPARGAHAQTAADFWERAERAYQELEYDSAAVLLRRGLASPDVASLPRRARLQALTYLGATELFREQRDSAVAAFRQILHIEPRHRPDQLVFPPEVSTLFEETRLTTKAVIVIAAPRTDISSRADRFTARLLATSYHDVVLTITRDGAPVRTLHSGAISDSLDVQWDGQSDAGALVGPGVYQLNIVSRVTGIGAVRTLRLPLTVRHTANDTLAWPVPPADSLFQPERTAGALSGRSLATGLAGAVATIALPSLVGGNGGSGARYAVAGALTVSGIAGLLKSRSGSPIPRNIAANRQLRTSWERQREDVRGRNVERLARPRLIVEAGTPVAVP